MVGFLLMHFLAVFMAPWAEGQITVLTPMVEDRRNLQIFMLVDKHHPANQSSAMKQVCTKETQSLSFHCKPKRSFKLSFVPQSPSTTLPLDPTLLVRMLRQDYNSRECG